MTEGKGVSVEDASNGRETSQVRVDPKTHRRAKIEAARRELSVKELVRLALEAYLSKRPA